MQDFILNEDNNTEADGSIMATRFKHSEMVSKLLKVIMILISFLGLVIFSFGLFLGYMAYSTSSWHPARATIIESSVVPVKGKTGFSYRPQIEYRYNVNGEEHTGDSIRFMNFNYGDEEDAAEAAARYAVGKEVEARYHPNYPKMTVLEPGVHSSDLFVPLAGVALVIVALLLRTLRKRYFLQ